MAVALRMVLITSSSVPLSRLRSFEAVFGLEVADGRFGSSAAFHPAPEAFLGRASPELVDVHRLGIGVTVPRYRMSTCAS